MPLQISDISESVGEFQRIYLYKTVIESISSEIRTGLSNKGYSSLESVINNVDLFNLDAVFPDRKTNSKKYPWSGEFIEIPMEDASTRNATLNYVDDQKQSMYKFFSVCKDMSGNEDNQAAVEWTKGKFNMLVYKVSVDKETITACRKLIGCKVYGLDSEQLRKDGTDINKVKVEIRWDKNLNLEKGFVGEKI